MQKPKDLKKSDFNSLDIFLFSNGQQDSPPRKYNLHTDELKFWDNTLNYLAREHYGSKHRNIELYTVDGRRIAGARELRGGSAYVAVEPPARFVQSGYDNYLIKASRSWEKRQKSNDAISLSETDKNESSNTTDVTNINMYQDILIAPAPSTITKEQIEVKTNTDTTAKKNEPKPALAKQMQKKKITSPQPNPSILRKKYVNPVSLMAKRGTIPSKETSKSDTVKKKVDSHVIKNSHRESSSLKVVSPVAAKSKAESPMIANINEIEIKSPDNIYYYTQVPREVNHDNPDPPTLVVVDTVAENELSEKQESASTDVLSKIYHNEEHHQSIFINPTRTLTNNDGTEEQYKSQREHSETEHKVVINSGNNDEKNILSETYFEVHGIEAKTNVIRSTDATPTLDKKLLVCGNQTSESCAIYINPGETVNLKLSVEIKNGPISMDNCKSTNLIFQCNSTGKLEKGTQGAISTAAERECLRGECEQTGRAGAGCSAPLHGILGREAVKDMKTIVCNCNCCSTSEKIIPFKAAPVYFDNNNYFILLPSEKLNGNILGCNCIFESSSKTKLEPVNTAKIIVSETKILKEDSLQLAKERLSALKTSSKTSNCVENHHFTNSSTPMIKNEEKKPTGMTERCMSNQAVKECMVCAEAKSTTTISFGRSDASTQTDWARLLLEVRLHEDGHYTFHLPPLEILKIYNVV